jgi:hypothetical protein
VFLAQLPRKKFDESLLTRVTDDQDATLAADSVVHQGALGAFGGNMDLVQP